MADVSDGPPLSRATGTGTGDGHGRRARARALAAAAGLVAQPWLTAYRDRHPGLDGLAWPSVGAVAIYAGYFGAGSGLMMLTTILVLVDARLTAANALKNVLVGAIAVVSAAVLVVTAPVDWSAVVPLAAGLLVGSVLGPVVARRVPVAALRRSLVVGSVALAIVLWLHPG